MVYWLQVSRLQIDHNLPQLPSKPLFGLPILGNCRNLVVQHDGFCGGAVSKVTAVPEVGSV